MNWYDMVHIIENEFGTLDTIKNLKNVIITEIRMQFKKNCISIDCLVKPSNVTTGDFENYTEINFYLKNHIEFKQNGVCKTETSTVEISKVENKMFLKITGAISLEISCNEINCQIYPLS